MQDVTYGILGSGSWATALAKILTDNEHTINWWVRNEENISGFKSRRHNPHYLRNAYFDVSRLKLSSSVEEVIHGSDCLLIVIPSAYLKEALEPLPKDIFRNKKIVSAVKGIVPGDNILLNEYLEREFKVDLQDYFTVLGPCHAEEVAAEKLSYLTFSGVDGEAAAALAETFRAPYLNTLWNTDIFGVQYAAILKNIYAIAAGIAHGLDYGDNFLSVLIANSADEMAGFLRRQGRHLPEVGTIDHNHENAGSERTNYAASVYLGDLLVTCYSLYSRNRTFGNMIGKGYSVKAAQLEMNMVAEGYNASRCMHKINETVKADMPIAAAIFKILWEGMPAAEGFERIEKLLV